MGQEYALAAQNIANRMGRLGALREPVKYAIFLQLYAGRLAERHVSSKILDKSTVTRAARIGRNEREYR